MTPGCLQPFSEGLLIIRFSMRGEGVSRGWKSYLFPTTGPNKLKISETFGATETQAQANHKCQYRTLNIEIFIYCFRNVLANCKIFIPIFGNSNIFESAQEILEISEGSIENSEEIISCSFRNFISCKFLITFWKLLRASNYS